MSAGHRVPEDGAAFRAPEVRRFRHKADGYKLPRYWTVLGVVWLTLAWFVVHDLLGGIHGADIDRWDAGKLREALFLIGFLVTVSLLWSAWHREEQYPELLPDAEFEARFPPHPGAPPTTSRRYTEEVTPTGGQLLDPRAVVPKPYPAGYEPATPPPTGGVVITQHNLPPLPDGPAPGATPHELDFNGRCVVREHHHR